MKKFLNKKDAGIVPVAILVMPIAAIVFMSILVIAGVKTDWTFIF